MSGCVLHWVTYKSLILFMICKNIHIGVQKQTLQVIYLQGKHFACWLVCFSSKKHDSNRAEPDQGKQTWHTADMSGLQLPSLLSTGHAGWKL